ncbi:hypothetical protein BDR05DRAFT_464481 [Suillus weaverae]|nr:hypothetical protein BDR05DRAFT_464481 [Suillus weaverae]
MIKSRNAHACMSTSRDTASMFSPFHGSVRSPPSCCVESEYDSEQSEPEMPKKKRTCVKAQRSALKRRVRAQMLRALRQLSPRKDEREIRVVTIHEHGHIVLGEQEVVVMSKSRGTTVLACCSHEL